MQTVLTPLSAQKSKQKPPASSDLVCFSSEQIGMVWEGIVPLVKSALDRGSRYSLTDILNGLLDQEMQLWTAYDGTFEAVLITALQDDYCLLLVCAGKNMENWVKWLTIVENWAKESGAKEMRVYGRVGWARVLGYDIEYTKMVKTL